MASSYEGYLSEGWEPEMCWCGREIREDWYGNQYEHEHEEEEDDDEEAA